MYPGYWEDYMNDGTPSPDNIRNVYKISFKGECFSSLAEAWKASIYAHCGKYYNSATRISMLKELGATIEVRQYNDTQKKWLTIEYDTL